MPEQSFDVYCPHCNIQTEAHVVAHGVASAEGVAIEGFDPSDAEYRHAILFVALCRRCDAPFLIKRSIWGVPGEFETVTSEEILFPVSSRLPLESVPVATKRSYDQAVRCYASSSFDACALMCRRALESLCKELGCTSGSLQAKLDSLFSQGIIDSRLAAWAHGIRAVGNEAAHDTDAELSQSDARDALDFTEAILMYVFVLGARFQAFSDRRKKAPVP